MSRTAAAAKSASAKFCAATISKLADACTADAKDAAVGPILCSYGLAHFYRMVENRFSGGTKTSDVDALDLRLEPLLNQPSRSGVQDSAKFNRQIDDLLKPLRDLIA